MNNSTLGEGLNSNTTLDKGLAFDPNRVVCIVRDVASAFSETFIDAHEAGLPYRTFTLSGDIARLNGSLVMGESLGARVGQKIERIFRRRQWTSPSTQSYRRAFFALRPAVVVAEFGTVGARICEACAIARIPLIVFFRGYDAHVEEMLERHRDAYQRMFDQAYAMVAVSLDIRARLISLGADARKIVYDVSSDLDCASLTPTDVQKNPPDFLMVGRLVDKKAPHLTLLAFHQALRERPEIRLRIIGDGRLAGVCRDIVRSLQMENSVELLGPAGHTEVFEAMRCARAFVQHSVKALNGDSEGTPIAVLEAGACALPVIATRHAGIADVVLHEETGLLVEEHDIDGMARHFVRLAADPELAYNFGQAGRARVCEKFNRRLSMQKLISLIEGAACGLPVSSDTSYYVTQP